MANYPNNNKPTKCQTDQPKQRTREKAISILAFIGKTTRPQQSVVHSRTKGMACEPFSMSSEPCHFNQTNKQERKRRFHLFSFELARQFLLHANKRSTKITRNMQMKTTYSDYNREIERERDQKR